MIEKEYYTLTQVSELTDIKQATLRKQIRTNKRTHFHNFMNRYFIYKSDLMKDFTDAEIKNKKE